MIRLNGGLMRDRLKRLIKETTKNGKVEKVEARVKKNGKIS